MSTSLTGPDSYQHFGVAFNQDGAHAGFIVRIVGNDHLAGRSHQGASCAGAGEVVAAYLHLRRAGHVLNTVVVHLQILRHGPVEGHFQGAVGQSAHRLHAGRGKAFHA